LNRITSGIDNTGNYNLVSVGYDKNGNITGLNRKGHTNAGATSFGTMDNLVYTYQTTSNQLKKVLDNGNDTYGFKDGVNQTTEFTYDGNGNMVTDANKGITSIAYNYLNLPTQVTFSSGNIQYFYDASGIKQKKVVSTGTITEYAGNYVYEGGSLKFFNHAEGYIEPDGSSFVYVYQYKDHLGNIRLSYEDSDGNGVIYDSTEIREEHNYYPFGLNHKGYNYTVNGTHHKYMFGGKEYQDEAIGSNNLNWYDITARNYDPALGRWMNIDPLAEKGRRHSPYNYAFDNPIRFVDYDGMWPEWGGVLDAVQTGLDVVGMIPGAGNVADVVNAGISVARGDYTGAALNMAAAVPGAGLAVGGAKIAKTIVKTVKAGKKAKAAKATLKANKLAGKQGEKIVKGQLEAGLKEGETLLEQASFKLDNGKIARPDFTTIGKGGTVKKITEVKTGKASLSKNQKDLQKNGGTLTGKKAGDFKGATAKPDDLKVKRVDLQNQ